jgi:hypothetical protein
MSRLRLPTVLAFTVIGATVAAVACGGDGKQEPQECLIPCFRFDVFDAGPAGTPDAAPCPQCVDELPSGEFTCGPDPACMPAT